MFNITVRTLRIRTNWGSTLFRLSEQYLQSHSVSSFKLGRGSGAMLSDWALMVCRSLSLSYLPYASPHCLRQCYVATIQSLSDLVYSYSLQISLHILCAVLVIIIFYKFFIVVNVCYFNVTLLIVARKYNYK